MDARCARWRAAEAASRRSKSPCIERSSNTARSRTKEPLRSSELTLVVALSPRYRIQHRLPFAPRYQALPLHGTFELQIRPFEL